MAEKESTSSWMEFFIDRRFLILLFILLGTIGLSIPLAKMGVDMDNRPERFAPAGDQSFIDLAALQEEFGRDDYFVLLMKGDVWSPAYLQQLEVLHVKLETISPPPDTIWSLYNAPLMIEKEGQTKLVRKGKDYQRPEALKKGSAHLQTRLVNEEGTWSAIWCQAPVLSRSETSDYLTKIQDLATVSSEEGFSVLVGGTPAFSHKLDSLTKSETDRLGGLAFALMILFLSVWFRRFSMVVGPFLVMLLGIVWTYGVMALMGVSLSYMTSILPGFLISVCVGDSMHLQALVADDLNRGKERKAAIVSAFQHAWKPVLLTTLTTAGGLLSFQVSALPAVQELGKFGAIGVAMACFLSMTLIPAVLSFVKQDPESIREEPAIEKPQSGFLGFCIWISKSSYATVVMVGFGVLFCTALWGASQLKTEHDPLSWLPEDNPTKIAMNIVDQDFGGASELTLWVHSTDKQGILATRHLQDLYALEERVLAYRDEQSGISLNRGLGVLDTLRLSYEASGKDKDFDALMNDKFALTQYVTNLSLARPSWSSGVVAKDGRSAKIVYRIPWQPAQSYIPLRKYLDQTAKDFEGRGIKVQPLGVFFTLLATFGVLVDDLLMSFGFAVVVISVLMFAFLRDVRLSVISLVPNLLPVTLTLGTMGWFEIPLDLGTVLFASIVLGICIDDTIHFLYHFRASYQEKGDVDEAIAHAMQAGGKAIFITSLLLICCMGVYLFSEMLNLQRFGLLMLISVGFALICDLLLTPILLRKAFRNKPQ